MLEVTYQEAYAETCRALGEAIVTEGFLSRRIAELEAELAAARMAEQVEEVDPAPTT